ncbi:MAG: MFS transporter [Rhodospirillales bacterium]
MNDSRAPAGAPVSWRKPVVILVCGTLILLFSVGIRQTFGLFMAPVSADLGWGREVFALAIATQNLAWGLSQPFVGAIADRFGAGKVIALCGLLYTGGLYMMATAQTPGEIVFSNGFMIGFALSGCGYPVILAVIGRSVPERKRSLFLGIGSTGGSSGQLLMIPVSQFFITSAGWAMALLYLMVLSALIVPMAAALAGRVKDANAPGGSPGAVAMIDQSIGKALREAKGHSGYILLTAGFFVCGWQIGFVAAHFPAYLSDQGFSPAIAAAALALIGLFNIIGTFGAGMLGGTFRKKTLLAGLYFFRAVLFALFLVLPHSETGILVFSAAIGIMWLATVPLTSGLVGQMLGVRYLGMLYGIIFMSHQLGSFCGVWLGGYLYDTTGSYDAIWWGSIVLGLAAAALHVMIDDRTAPRLAKSTG